MSEKDRENSQVRDCRQTNKLDDDFVPEQAWPICPNCLTPCHPLQFYCYNCNSNEAINPLASYMPFVRIRFNLGMLAHLWRRILYDKHASIVLKVILLLLLILGIMNFPGCSRI